MRDIVVTILILGSLPFILRRPFFGVMVWTWLGFMNPHRLAWGFSTTMPFALIVFLTTVTAYMFSKEPKRIPITAQTVLLALFVLWMFITTVNSMFPGLAWAQWDKVWRIQLGVLLTLALINSRERMLLLVWTIAVSLGFYGFKGGIWTLMTGGGQRVYGPPGTFIGGNNELGLALIMVIPLLWYLTTQTRTLWVKLGLYAAVGCTLVATIGTHSRGALVGLAVMGLMFFVKSRHKALPLVFALAFGAVVPHIVPQEWFDRMNTIETYEEDMSALNRFKAWRNAYEIANRRTFGGGYESIAATGGTDAHSIYFEVLGEQGYIGLALFLSLGLATWLRAAGIRRIARRNADLRWAGDLAAMLQVSLAGYATAGAFLGMAYFDFLYVIVAIIVKLGILVAEAEPAQTAQATAKTARGGVGWESPAGATSAMAMKPAASQGLPPSAL